MFDKFDNKYKKNYDNEDNHNEKSHDNFKDNHNEKNHNHDNNDFEKIHEDRGHENKFQQQNQGSSCTEKHRGKECNCGCAHTNECSCTH